MHVAYTLGSPLGRLIAFGVKKPRADGEAAPSDVEVSNHMDFRDATDASPGGFLEHLAVHMTNPLNQSRRSARLTPVDPENFTLPDLRSQGFVVPAALL